MFFFFQKKLNLILLIVLNILNAFLQYRVVQNKDNLFLDINLTGCDKKGITVERVRELVDMGRTTLSLTVRKSSPLEFLQALLQSVKPQVVMDTMAAGLVDISFEAPDTIKENRFVLSEIGSGFTRLTFPIGPAQKV